MAAGYQELFVEQGANYSTSITLDDSNGEAFDLTDYQAKCQMKKSYYSTNATAEFATTISGPTDGIITLTMDSNVSANIAAGRYVYDVIIKSSANTVTRVLEGIVNIIPQVTKF
jgi:hypothetical protein